LGRKKGKPEGKGLSKLVQLQNRNARENARKGTRRRADEKNKLVEKGAKVAGGAWSARSP